MDDTVDWIRNTLLDSSGNARLRFWNQRSQRRLTSLTQSINEGRHNLTNALLSINLYDPHLERQTVC